ncbi:RNA polymerase sigma factor [Aureispira anguillae]|uniref:RNA polymerase subunit sigma n=1 Tax=Aureispira anguillae TaxID=2864201 RepID=A0A915YFR5_9BACT|nr:DUF6596 domain-containing protein [Aureispira anguillae]BDS12217.1 RNA polymerase subunit sigma [Aureispira anguillae]
MNKQHLIPHLFRNEFSKIVTVLCKKFGLANIQLAEDIVAETFLIATETWGLKGIPPNPTAWLYAVAQNKTKDILKRNQVFKHKITPDLKDQPITSATFQLDLSEQNILDGQIQMLFALCNPAISTTSQIALALKILCGFGVHEIANAFLTNKATINKRLHRGKQKLRQQNIDLSFPLPHEIENRLPNILSILYLLFNEGYYSKTAQKTLQKDICLEAMQLLYNLLKYPPTNQPQTNALMALFCFQASRFDARTNHLNEPILYAHQDQNIWDKELIAKGNYYLNLSAQKNMVTKYHLEAAIAYWHTNVTTPAKEKWEAILQLYNQLLQIAYSPIAALNRTYALSQTNSCSEAIQEALKIDLKDNHLYYALLAELYKDLDPQKQLEYLQLTLAFAKTENDRKVLLKKIKAVRVD